MVTQDSHLGHLVGCLGYSDCQIGCFDCPMGSLNGVSRLSDEESGAF